MVASLYACSMYMFKLYILKCGKLFLIRYSKKKKNEAEILSLFIRFGKNNIYIELPRKWVYH